jgi:hypothetical protein
MTIITHVAVKQGSEPEWDAIIREGLDAASGRPGWLGGRVLIAGWRGAIVQMLHPPTAVG